MPLLPRTPLLTLAALFAISTLTHAAPARETINFGTCVFTLSQSRFRVAGCIVPCCVAWCNSRRCCQSGDRSAELVCVCECVHQCFIA